MSDIGQAKLEDSNMAGYGGEEMRNLRKDAAATDEDMKGAGTKVGLEVWRVENTRTESDTPDFGIKRWPKEEYGNFFSGDSYIVLKTYNPKDPETGKINKDKLAWDVHFWLGKDTSIDEQGVAAYKTVEIDDLLDDGPIQHREVQFAESQKFQSYFESLNYQEGGIESGFRKVKPEEYEPRLIQVRRTKKSVRGIPVPVAATSLNQGDVFVLDCGTTAYLWVGESANAFEKTKGAYVLHNILASRNGKAKRMEVDDTFWQVLNGSEADVKSADEGDKQPEPSLDNQSVSLFQLSDASGSLTFTTVVEKSTITRDQLKSEDVWIIATNVAIYVWVGEGASAAERRNAIISAGKWLNNDSDLPNTTPITRILEGQISHEPMFDACFTQS